MLDVFCLLRYTIKSGSIFHPDDHLPYDSTIEIKPLKRQFNSSADGFIVINRVTSEIVTGEIDYEKLSFIEELRIMIGKKSLDKWILINDIEFVRAPTKKKFF
jgi:hypothetical protein